MKSIRCAVVAGVALVCTAASADAQGFARPGTGFGVSWNMPIDYLDSLVSPGFGAMYRNTRPTQTEEWSTGSTFSFNWFPGRNNVESVMYFGSTFDFRHDGERVYQYGGLGIQLTRYSYKPSTSSTTTTQPRSSDIGVALAAGIGMNLGKIAGAQSFAEFGVNAVFTSPEIHNWFPIRFGIKF
jgi:hypothetical protein